MDERKKDTTGIGGVLPLSRFFFVPWCLGGGDVVYSLKSKIVVPGSDGLDLTETLPRSARSQRRQIV